jgi:HSP20 family protein
MDYIKIKFKNDFDQQISKSGRVLEDMFRTIHPLFSMTERTLKPQIDVFETKKEIDVLAEIAGVDPQELEVEVSRKTIKIAGVRRQDLFHRKGAFRLAEIQYGRFERAFILPALIDPDTVLATYADGMLHIRLIKIQKDRTYEVPISDG